MVKRLLEGPWEAFKTRFPDRQIYHRSDGQVRYFAITSTMQAIALGVACALVAWLAIATANMAVGAYALNQREARLAQMEARYQNLLEEARAAEAAAIAFVESSSETFDRTAGEFRLRHETLRRLLDFADDLSAGDDAQSPGLEGGRILMAAVPSDPDPRTALIDLAMPASHSGSAEAQVAALVDEQDAVLAAAEDAAESRLENLRAVLRLTGMRPEELAEQASADEGSGGPLLSLQDAALFGAEFDLDDPFDARVSRIASRLVETQELERFIEAIPLGLPVDGVHRLTSNYGMRSDPFTRRPAFHAGKDFAGPRGTPIIAPAPGRVVYAGWRSGYGRTVEVDHGYGFRTRYAHLHTIDVRRGDRVALGQKLGGMGSSGRSTATHLHYEVWFDNAHADPDRFLRAGRYVQ
ncbi:MAG: peptidoglycan DD-metalloendopeptidase family protein [Pseudomonadota bacterium]